jgi:diguanylate cyclase (GGDEF)-like protein/PAS domain S-box-containing protein
MNDNFYKQLIEESPTGYAYHRIICDEDGIACDYEFIEVNAAFEKLTGLRGSDIVGRRVTEILPGIRTSEFDWIHFYGDIAINGGKKEFEQFSEPLHQWYRVKAYSPEKNYFATHFIDIPKEMGQLTELKNSCVLSTQHDITERKMMEESLKKSEEEYRLLFENAVEAIVVIQNREIQICNPIAQRLTGYSEKELTSKPFLDLIYCEDVGNVRDIHNLRLKGESYNYKPIYRLVRKDKEIRWVESNGIKINWKGKEAVLNFVIDITERKQAEEALQMNQRELTDIIEFLPDATLAVDKERRVIIWNKAIEKMTCIPASEMIGKCDYAYTIPFYGEARPQLMDLVFLDDEEIATQYSNLTREGDTLMAEVFCLALYNNKGAWVSVKASPLHDQSGNIIGAIESIRDITERKRAEEALKESEEKHRLLITQMNQGLAVHEVILDETGKAVDYRFLDANESFERLTGLKHENIIGKTVLEILPGTESYWIEKYGHVAMTGEPLQYENYSKELDKYYETVAYSPRHKQFAVIISDITKRKRLETALSNEKKLLETTLISVGDGVISTDNKGNIVFLNRVAEFLTGWTQEAARGKSIEEVFIIVNEFTREKGEKIVKKVLESGKTLELANHTILISKDGIERPIEDSAAPIRDGNEDIHGVILVFHDVTERKKAEDALKLSEEKYRLLAENVSDVISVYNIAKNKFTYVSPSVLNLRGFTAEEAMNERLEESLSPEALVVVRNVVARNVKEFMENSKEPKHYITEGQQSCKNGDLIWVEISRKYRYNSEGDIESVGIIRNIEERKKAEKQILYISYHDQLTGLYNRRFYEEELKRLDTKRNLPLTIVMGDVNGLKLINDSFGHAMGDELLRKVVEVIKNGCRADDIIARLGGDEFVIILPKTDAFETEQIIKRIKDLSLKEKVGNIDISISFGYATKSNEEENIQEIFKYAEDLMYRHKRSER